MVQAVNVPERGQLHGCTLRLLNPSVKLLCGHVNAAALRDSTRPYPHLHGCIGMGMHRCMDVGPTIGLDRPEMPRDLCGCLHLSPSPV